LDGCDLFSSQKLYQRLRFEHSFRKNVFLLCQVLIKYFIVATDALGNCVKYQILGVEAAGGGSGSFVTREWRLEIRLSSSGFAMGSSGFIECSSGFSVYSSGFLTMKTTTNFVNSLKLQDSLQTSLKNLPSLPNLTHIQLHELFTAKTLLPFPKTHRLLPDGPPTPTAPVDSTDTTLASSPEGVFAGEFRFTTPHVTFDFTLSNFFFTLLFSAILFITVSHLPLRHFLLALPGDLLS
jgi:hypothetical protein